MSVHSEPIKDWDNLNTFSKIGLIYRGQRCADWELKTSLDRCVHRESVERTDRVRVEKMLLREFRRVYHQFGQHEPELGYWLEWNALMQHHGAPTRILDFTYSFFVAVYFAVEEADGAAAVWAVNRKWARKASVELLTAAGRPKDCISKLYSKETEEGREDVIPDLLFDKDEVRSVSIVTPFRLNERLRAQKGVFLMPGDVTSTFMENLNAMPGHDDANNAIKLVIPQSLRRTVLEKLHYMNISRTTLFPGLDGFARSLSIYHPDYDPDHDKDKHSP